MEIEESKGGSRRWSAWLPPDVKADDESQTREQHEAWMRHVVVGLGRSIAAGQVTGSSGRYWVRAVQTHVFDLRRPVGSDETRVQLVQLLYAAITMHSAAGGQSSEATLDPTLQSKWANVLARLLKKWKDLAGSAVTLPWRPLYDTLLETFAQGFRQPVHHATAVHALHVSALVSLVKKARRFFPADATQEVVDTIRPHFCPHDNSSTFKAQALLCLFVPSSSFDNALIAEVFEKWAWIERSGQWDANWISLLARFAKTAHSSQRVQVDWSPHLSQLFTHVLRILDVSTAGASKLPKPSHHKAPKETHVFTPHEKEHKIANMAKLLAYILTPSTQSKLSTELQALRQLFRSIESYYYPSNSGNWSDVLAVFLRSIAHHYAERVGKERSKKSLQQDRKLTHTDHKEFIAILDEPLKQAIYGKGAIPSAATEAIRHLAYIEPALLFPSLLNRIYSALESLTATHQTVNAIEALIAICHPLLSRQNYPVGAHHLPQLLKLTLPGIDANDRKKTMATYAFYTALFSHVPLFDASSVTAESGGKRRKQKEGGDADAAAKDATAVFSDWSVELLETLFSVLRNQDKPSGEHYDQALRSFFKKMVDLFFQQLSPQLYALLSKKLLQFISYNVVTNATKEFGFMVASASLANPDAALKAYLPLFYKKLIKTNKESGAVALKDSSDDEMKWHLHLMASVVRNTGVALVPHVEKLRTVITECFASNKKSLAKAAGKLLRNVLYALSHYYPTDYRSAPPAVWNSEEFEQTHWKTWGRQGDANTPTIQWHQPSEEELKLACDLISHLVPGALQKLQSLTGNANALSKDELWVVLQLIRSVVRGAATILPQEKGSYEPREQWDTELPHQEQPPSVTYPSQLWRGIEARNGQVRGEISKALSAASGAFKTARADDITSLAKLIKVMNLVLNFNGISQQKLHWLKMIYKGTKRRYAKKLETAEDKQDTMDIGEEATKEKQEKQHYRRLLIDRANIEYLVRVNQTNWRNDVGDEGKQLLHHLYDFATSASVYAGVRKKAQGALHNAWKYRPFARHMFLHSIIAKLSDRNVGEDELKGNAFLLFNRSVIHLITREWRYLAPFLVSIASSHVHSNEKLQTLLYQLFVLFSVSSYPVPLAAPSPPTSALPVAAQLSADILQSAAKDVEFHDRKNLESYNSALQDLLAIAEDPALHWRYQVITSACILFLLRPDPLPSLQAVRLFLRGTVNELQPIRTLSRKALSILLKIYKPHFPKEQGSMQFTYGEYRTNSARTQKPLTRGEWNSSNFIDNNWEGWNANVFTGGVKTSQPPRSAASDEAIQHVANELSNFLDDPLMKQQFLHYLAQDHHVRADEAEGKSQERSWGDMAKQLSSILGSSIGRSALSGGLGKMGKSLVAQAANEVLRELLKQNKHWPYVVNKVPSSNPNSFERENAELFKGLFQLSLARGGSNQLSTDLFNVHLRPFLDAFLRNEEGTDASGRLHAGDQERSHALAAEIMSGAMRCLKYGGFEYAEKLWNYWVPFLERIIIHAPTDCVRNWFIALRFGIYNLDVRRIVPLGDLLVRQLKTLTVDSKKEGDSLRDAKVLQFVQPFLAEASWRAADYNLQVLSILASRISSPFKQVRSELSHLLVIIFRNLWRNPAVEMPASDDALNSFFAAVPAQVYKMKTTADVDTAAQQKAADDAMDEEGRVRSTLTEDTSHAREALLLTLWDAAKSSSGVVAPYIHHFLRLLFASLADEDRDTVNVAKQCAALAAQMILPEQAPRSSFVEHLLALPKPDTLWHTRAAMLPFLQIFLFNHRFLLNEEERQQVRELVISLLADTRVEVRELASVSLSSLLHGEEDASVTALAQRFLATLGQPLRRRDIKNAPEERVRHGAALGLAAIVQSVTYTVPAWLPSLLVSLAPYEDDFHASVKDAMKKSFAEFHRTHQEAWELHQEAFTHDQLSVVEALGKTPTSYYL